MSPAPATSTFSRLRAAGPGNLGGVVVLALLLVLPLAAWWTGQKFYLDFATRITILAIVATSLNFILGYGGLISFGHAAFVGIGAYCVGIPAYYDLASGFVHIPLAIAASALFALVTGAISLRTRGVYFIMITMAFAQMAYYLFLSLDEYGGNDGLTIYSRSVLPPFNLEQRPQLFLLAYVSLVVVLALKHRFVNSRFGMVLRGARANETRMIAIGFNTYAYRLAAYVIAGAIAGYGGALLGNFTNFITPDMMGWTRSGDLMFMVILGGAGSLFGPVMGAVAILLLEEYLARLTVYWQLPFGLLLIATVLYQRGGLNGLIERLGGRK
jgi:branched-chain amino acid transport system permease protein